jgi:choline-sulfatase
MQGMPLKLRRLATRGFYPRDGHPVEFLRMRFSYYNALVSQIDDAVGSMLEHVDLESTLVIFCSDHGVYLGRRGRIGKHPFVPFEEIGRVPMFAAGFGVPHDTRVAAPVSLLDLAPTFLKSAGIEIPPDLDGIPLQSYFADPKHASDRPLFCRGLTSFSMVRVGSQKYYRSRDRTSEMLFDLEADPGELKNLAGKPKWSAVQRRLADELAKVVSASPSSLPRFESSSV